MRLFAPTIGLGLAVIAQLFVAEAGAADSRFEHSLRLLAPNERLIQLCDYTAMQRIRKQGRDYRPDRAIADATVQTRVVNNKVDAKGAAFRSRGKWYALSYSCAGSDDHMKILSFNYKIGAEIPQSKWAAYGLWQ
jgi:hypothetical protein